MIYRPTSISTLTAGLGLACAALLTACGGGSDTPTSEPEAPVVRDTTPPTVNRLYPTEGVSVQTSQIRFAGTAGDDTALQQVAVEVNGTQSLATLDTGSFDATATLAPGLNAYTIIATDTAGNQTRQTGTVYFGHRVAAANSHSGALLNGKLYTWGRNNFGQTGLGFVSSLTSTTVTHPVAPTLVSSSATFVSLAFNQNHSIALDASGKLWSWGNDADGQLGRGDAGRETCTGSTPNCRKTPGEVTGLDNVLAVSAGYNHVVALRKDGAVWAFGLNDLGQLGDGTTTTRSTPVQVQWAAADATTVGKIIQVSASSKSSYALDDKGQLWGWGRNQYANLGQGSASTGTASQTVPLLIPMPSGAKIVSIANGRDHVLALAQDGKVYAWGLNATSQVGFNGYLHAGKTTAWESPVLSPRSLPAMETNPAVEVYANGNTSYVRRADGKVYPWGMYGATDGTGATIYADLDEPEDRLTSVTNVVDLAVGALHQVALRNDGQLFSWGWSFEGSLGGGATTISTWMYNTPLTPVLP